MKKGSTAEQGEKKCLYPFERCLSEVHNGECRNGVLLFEVESLT